MNSESATVSTTALTPTPSGSSPCYAQVAFAGDLTTKLNAAGHYDSAEECTAFCTTSVVACETFAFVLDVPINNNSFLYDEEFAGLSTTAPDSGSSTADLYALTCVPTSPTVSSSSSSSTEIAATFAPTGPSACSSRVTFTGNVRTTFNGAGYLGSLDACKAFCA